MGGVSLAALKFDWEKILELLYDGVIITDEHCNMVFVNHTARRVFKVEEEYLGKHLFTISPNARLPLAIKSGQSEIGRYQVLSESSFIIYSNYAIFDARRKVVGGIAVFREVNEVGGEGDEANIRKSLQENQRLLGAIMDYTQDAIMVVDENGIINRVNNAYTQVTGHSKEEAIGELYTLDITPEQSVHQKVLQSKVPIRDKELITRQGRHFISHGVPILVGNQLLGSVSISQDVTDRHQLQEELEKARTQLRRRNRQFRYSDIPGVSAAVEAMLAQCRELTRSTPVLLVGEEGTEPETLARAIHGETQPQTPLVVLDCGAYPTGVLRGKLFGYAENSRGGGGEKGCLERAGGGILYLKNIDRLDRSLQERLTRTFQEKRFRSVGGRQELELDVRVIMSTHVDLEQEVKKGRFDAELYYRMGLYTTIRIPSLSQRPEDIPAIAEAYLADLGSRCGTQLGGISRDGAAYLQQRKWRRNTAELKHFLAGVALSMAHDRPVMTQRDILQYEGPRGEENRPVVPLEAQMAESEKAYILHALEQNNGNRTRTAKALDISIRSLHYKLEKYGIT